MSSFYEKWTPQVVFSFVRNTCITLGLFAIVVTSLHGSGAPFFHPFEVHFREDYLEQDAEADKGEGSKIVDDFTKEIEDLS